MNRFRAGIIVAFPILASCAAMEDAYQRDMDRVRIRHVDYVASLVVEFLTNTNQLPLADRVQGKPLEVLFPDRRRDEALLTQLAQAQIELLPTEDLETALAKGLHRSVRLPADPQSFASYAPNIYIYDVDVNRACVAGHLYGKAPGTYRVYSYYKYERCVRATPFAHPLSPEEQQQRHDADIFRVRHLIEWARLVEAFHEKAGRYPLQNRAEGDKIVIVQIATREQQAFLDPRSPKYTRAADFTKGPGFTAVDVREFVREIESALGRGIDERYDPQSEPDGTTPLYIGYFVDRNGYLIWTACHTCRGRADSIVIPLGGGMPTLNIGSPWFVANIRKTQTIESLQSHREFIDFVGKGPSRPAFYEDLERAQAHDSKN